jgi:serine/threonine-protein kinase
MEPEKLKQIEEIYHSALEISSTERAAFLQNFCGADEVLLREVESLLTFEVNSEKFLNNLPESLAAEMFVGEDSAANPIGAEIGHYKVLQLIGKGGMGEVYLAEDLKLDRKVALKILPPEFAADEVRMSRFIREAKSASALNHPNILTIYEIGQAENIHFIAAEFINGKTLNEYVKIHSLNVKSALEIAFQIASALDEAHSAGIIHRDIKPDNVMIRDNGLVKLLDFGIAKLSEKGRKGIRRKGELRIEDRSSKLSPHLHNSPSSQIFTNLGTIIGTADYMSPEQAKGKEIDSRTDIFSFGVVLYQMMSGNLPFTGETASEIISAILNRDPKPLKTEIPIEISSIIEKCLKKNRNERYQTIKEVLFDLEEVRKDLTFVEASQRKSPITNEFTTNGQTHRLSVTNETIVGKFNPNRLFIGSLALLLISIFIYFGYQFFTQNKQIKSIAVMPFINESTNKEVEYLSDGMTEMLIKRLSDIPNLSVKARSTVFTYKNKEISANKIGLDLKVDAVLLGRLFQQGDDLKLNLELIETATENVLWSANYDRKMKDLASLQREIAGDVSENLRIKLTTAEQKQITKTYTNNSEAHQLYLRGRFHWNKRNIKDFQLSIEYFEQAIEKDPNYALAYSGLADTYVLIPLYSNSRPNEFMPQAKKSAQKALELDENLAEAHASLGRILNSFDYDWEGAEREFIKSIKLNPNYPTAHQWYAELLSFKERHDEALKEISKALELDPLSLTINRMKGNILGFAKRYDEAIAQLNKTAELYPENALVRYNLGDMFAAKEMYPESVEQYLIAFKLEGRSSQEIQNFKNAYQQKGWKGFWSEHLKSLIELQNTALQKEKNAYVNNESLAFAYAANKNKDKTLEYLKQAFAERDPSLITIKMSNVYDLLANDSEFKELIKKIGLPE